MSRYPERERKQFTEEHMVPSDAAVGGLNVPDLLTTDVSETQLDLAQRRWNDVTMTREGAVIAQAFERTQAQATSAASGSAAQPVGGSAVIVIDDDVMPAAMPMPPRVPPVMVIHNDVIVIDDDVVAAPVPPPAAAAALMVAQSSQASRSSPKIGAKRARAKTLQELGRTSFADQWAVHADSQEILPPPPSSQDAGDAGSQSSVRAVWNYPNSGNGAAATADDANDVPAAAGVKRKADDANEVPVFGGNGGNGNGAGRTFTAQPDGSLLGTDTDANGTKKTSMWTSIGHGQWKKHH